MSMFFRKEERIGILRIQGKESEEDLRDGRVK